MKALTIKAPWAQAIVHGTKRIENRTWKPHADVIGKRIAIHCGKSLAVPGDYDDPRAREQFVVARKNLTPKQFPVEIGCIIGTARVAGYVDALNGFAETNAIGIGLRVQEGYDVRRNEWWLGPIGWLLDSVRAVEPVAVRGQVGLWTVPDNIELVEVVR